MKKRTLILCGLLLSISLLAGCQTQEAATADKTQEASDISAEDTQEEDGQASDTDTTDDETEIAEPEDAASSAAQENVSGKAASFEISFEKETGEMKSDDGSISYLQYEFNMPKVTSADNPEAAEQINSYFVQRQEELMADCNEYYEWAKEDYQIRVDVAKENGTEGPTEDTFGYYSSCDYTIMRQDDTVISFQEQSSTYTGGAHGNNIVEGVTFDAKTGQRIQLADLMENEEDGKAEVDQILLEKAQEMQEKSMQEDGYGIFFEEYETYIPDVLTEDSWYLTEDGMTIVSNEYLLAPYAAGATYFDLPYETCDFIKEVYRK